MLVNPTPSSLFCHYVFLPLVFKSCYVAYSFLNMGEKLPAKCLGERKVPNIESWRKALTNERAPKNTTLADYIVVYCDGCCKGPVSQKTAGSAAIFDITAMTHAPTPALPDHTVARLPGLQSNQRAEIYSVITGLRTLANLNFPVVFVCDSKYTIDGFTCWMAQWIDQHGDEWWSDDEKRAKGGHRIQNRDLFGFGWRLLEKRKTNLGNASVYFCHVNGHANNVGNEVADYWSKRAADLPLSTDTLDGCRIRLV